MILLVRLSIKDQPDKPQQDAAAAKELVGKKVGSKDWNQPCSYKAQQKKSFASPLQRENSHLISVFQKRTRKRNRGCLVC
ncbi:hypothetical protein EFB08_02890 [Rufibacter latericius]|uniref:Uncharacterized protein n=1 Tax=Rufibacter latericius TaxID=2487040 RepID=A0A3M9N119_9BACT|nr:hypothetical protein EFB08_02890 [Rufibacter latericius]